MTDSDAALSEGQLRTNFWWMSVCFALNHGVVTTPLVIATTQLDLEVANVGNGSLYVMTLLSSLFLGAPLVSSRGAKAGLIFGMFFYCVYISGFAAAVLFKDTKALSWLFFVGGSICGGVAAGVLWTAQGAYFGATCTQLAASSSTPREALTADLAGKFAFVYLGLEVCSKMGFSGLQGLGVAPAIIAISYLVLGIASLGMIGTIINFKSASPPASPWSKVLAAASLWSDPLIWLLAPTNLTFGFCAAFMNGYVNKNFASIELGNNVVAFLAAITATTATVMARALGPLATAIGKGPVICMGAACFGSITLCLFALGCCKGWGWGLIVLYLLQGTGRAVYESTNRATFSDFFTGAKTEGAFANCMMQSSLAFAISFFLQTFLQGKTLAAIVLFLALLTPICYGLARLLLSRREQSENQALVNVNAQLASTSSQGSR